MCLTQARGQTQTEAKVLLMSQALQLENPSLPDARNSVKCYLADQGASERKGVKHVCGPQEVIDDVSRRLKNKTLAAHSVEARNITLLPNAMEMPGIFHIIYNALQHAFESLEEWDTYLPQLKAICKSLGESSYKSLHMVTTFKDDQPSSTLRIMIR